MEVREFRVDDAVGVEEILKLNDQYSSSLIEGREAMRRVSECEAAVYLVAVEGGTVVGVVKGVYDGSRALVHQLSVHPEYQRCGTVGSGPGNSEEVQDSGCANGFCDCEHEESGLLREDEV